MCMNIQAHVCLYIIGHMIIVYLGLRIHFFVIGLS